MNKASWMSVVALLAAGTAHAQTAEETAAFILWGAEDGRTFESDGSIVKTRQSNGAPATYEIIRPDGTEGPTSVTVEQLSNCKFRSTVKAGSKSETSIADLGNLVKANQYSGVEILEFKGPCGIRVDGDAKCSPVHMVPVSMRPDAVRTLKAIQYLKDEYCAGSAF